MEQTGAWKVVNLKVFATLVVLAFSTPVLAQQTVAGRPAVNLPPIIDGPALVGPAPTIDSTRAAANRLATHPLVSRARLAQAVADEPWTPWVAMHPVFGDSFSEARLPRTARVFQDVLRAISPVIGATKNANDRRRPMFADPQVVQCDPLDAQTQAQSSFPSGHGAGGWAWALVMAELVPQRANAILQRGRDFGDSRVICGYHFPSDIEAGRTLAAAVIARMHADPSFRRDMDAARRELARAYRD